VLKSWWFCDIFMCTKGNMYVGTVYVVTNEWNTDSEKLTSIYPYIPLFSNHGTFQERNHRGWKGKGAIGLGWRRKGSVKFWIVFSCIYCFRIPDNTCTELCDILQNLLISVYQLILYSCNMSSFVTVRPIMVVVVTGKGRYCQPCTTL
jgi:hypothetical protein